MDAPTGSRYTSRVQFENCCIALLYCFGSVRDRGTLKRWKMRAESGEGKEGGSDGCCQLQARWLLSRWRGKRTRASTIHPPCCVPTSSYADHIHRCINVCPSASRNHRNERRRRRRLGWMPETIGRAVSRPYICRLGQPILSESRWSSCFSFPCLTYT